MHRYARALGCLVGENHVGDPLRDGLDEVDRLTLDSSNHFERKLAVVNGFGKLVARGRGREIEPHRDIHYKNLTVATLVVEDAVKSIGAQAGEGYRILHERDPFSHALHTSSAAFVASTL